MFAVSIASLAFAFFFQQSFATLDLTLFPAHTPGGQCSDGSPAGYYYEAAASNAPNDLWVIFMQGGGHCITQASCQSRQHNALGSSTYWHPTMNGGSCYSNVATHNPDFYYGHHVFIPYCTGDWFSGMRTAPLNSSWNFIFDGHGIIQNVIKDLNAKYKMFQTADYVLVSGESAGGIGTFYNADYIANQFKASGRSPATVVKAAPIAGWFFSGNTTDQQSQPMMPPNDYPHWTSHQTGGWGHDSSVPDLWGAYIHPSCAAALGSDNAWHCFNVHTIYAYVSTPLFVLENKFDSDQLTAEMQMPNHVNSETQSYVAYFGEDMRRSIMDQLVYTPNPGNGLFLASCYAHVTGLIIGNNQKATIINHYNSSVLVGDWFWNRAKYPHVVYDTCTSSLPCNPTCKGF